MSPLLILKNAIKIDVIIFQYKSVDDVEYFQQEKPVQYKLQNSESS